ncbi:MAG: c-type cytochrome [Vicinamibacterales bacterium]|mgnify:FL=1
MRRVRSANSSLVRAALLAALVPGLVASYLAASVSAVPVPQAPAGAGARTVWDGVFTIDQADRGKRQFVEHCAECHGENLEGGEGKSLVGEAFWAFWGDSTVAELFAYVKTNMPFLDDGAIKGTLPLNTYLDIVTHILRSNDFPAGTQELTAESGTGVRIVKKDGPGELPAAVLAHVVGCLAPRAPDGSWHLEKGTRPRRASTPATTPDRDVPLGSRDFELKFVLTNLTRLVGHRVAVTGILLGTGGINGLNVNTVTSVAATCN